MLYYYHPLSVSSVPDCNIALTIICFSDILKHGVFKLIIRLTHVILYDNKEEYC